MPKTTPSLRDEELDLTLARVLRAGVILAGSIVALGGVMFMISQGPDKPHYRIFEGEPSSLRSISGIVQEAWRFDPAGVIQLGLLLLLATPIARVMFSMVGFLKQRDWLYVAFTLTVLALLAYSLLRG